MILGTYILDGLQAAMHYRFIGPRCFEFLDVLGTGVPNNLEHEIKKLNGILFRDGSTGIFDVSFLNLL
jgi:hypothetical protein